jgi:hypothetical protein
MRAMIGLEVDSYQGTGRYKKQKFPTLLLTACKVSEVGLKRDDYFHVDAVRAYSILAIVAKQQFLFAG